MTADGASRKGAVRVEDLYPLTPVQQGLVFHSLLDPESGTYAEQLGYTLEGDLDAAAFRRAWEEVVQRHPILRTGFASGDVKEPLQVVRSAAELPWRDEDWRTLDAPEVAAGLTTLMEEQRTTPFDLTRPPLLRAALVRVADQRYKFVWTFHHAILDGWSVALLLGEIQLLYDGFRRGSAPRLPSPRPFRDFIAWLKERDAASAEAFWRDRMGTFGDPTRIGIDSPRSLAEGEEEYDSLTRHLSKELTAVLEQCARSRDVTLNALVQAAWAILLSRYAGSADVVYGNTTSGRPTSLPGAESMLGLFINMLPVRAECAPTATFPEFLTALQKQQLDQREYEYAPLVDIQGWSGVPRGVPFFETAFVFENYPVRPFADPDEAGLVVRRDDYHSRTNYPLTIGCAPAEQLEISLAYDRARFADHAIVRMLGHFETLLRSIVENPDGRIGEFQMLGPGDEALLASWQHGEPQEPATSTLHERFEEQVQASPDAVAIASGGEQLTYRQLDLRAERVAGELRTRGAKAGTLVGIQAERSIGLLEGMLGTLKAGAAFLSLDPAYPAARRDLILDDAGVAILLVADECVGELSDFEGTVVGLTEAGDGGFAATDGGGSGGTPEPAEPLGPGAETGLEGPAYVLYTSGSTGRPKGVVVPHRAIVGHIDRARDRYGIAPDDRVLLFANSSFDAFLEQAFETLLTGARLVVRPTQLWTPAQFQDRATVLGLTVANLPPAYLHQWVTGGGGDFTPSLPALRLMISGGDVLRPDTVAAWKASSMADAVLLNAYGPTEMTVTSTLFEAQAASGVEDRASVPIGFPLGDRSVHVVSKDGSPVPVGVAGELLMGGSELAQGYWERPGLTAESFVPDPFSSQPGARLYRTGDLVRFLDDGALDFAGRVDHQVQIRGFRVELGEIEAALRDHAAVGDAVVVTHAHGDAGPQVVGYVELDPGQAVDAPVLREHVADRLPAYMVPSAFIFLDRLPRTTGGKVDRKALPEPDLETDGPVDGRLGTPFEMMLADIWVDLLPVEQVNVDDDFFALGGHSLIATQLVGRISRAFDVDLPMRTLFERSRLRDLASEIMSAKHAGSVGATRTPRITARSGDGPAPLSFAQERLWFLDELDPGSSAYIIPTALEWEGPLDVKVLEDAFREVVRRHESLRTVFRRGADQELVQEVAGTVVPAVVVVDLTAMDPAVVDQRLETVLLEEARRPFDLSEGPLVRATVVHLGPARHVLLFSAHHIVTDGWSGAVFAGEIAEFYESFRGGAPSRLGEPAIQYSDYAVWQREWLEAGALEEQIGYWKERLRGYPAALELPTDRPRPRVQRFGGGSVEIALSSEFTRKLTEWSREQGGTLFMALLGAFQTLLHRYSGQDDILVGTPIAGRASPDLEGLIGVFVNTLVMRADFAADPTVGDLFAQVRGGALDAYAHQDLPFERLVEELRVQRDLSRSPLVQVLFILQNEPPSGAHLEGVTIDQLRAETGATKFDLTLDVAEIGGEIRGSLEYSTDLYDVSTIERMVSHFEGLLGEMVRRPEARVSELGLLTEDEAVEQLEEWNATERSYADEQCVHELFEAQVEAGRDRVALEVDGTVVSYGALDARANQLARHLRSLGVGPDGCVGICLPRGVDLVVGLLGIQKAGGGYVPLDPAYPEERLRIILEDAGVSAVVTEEALRVSVSGMDVPVVSVDGDADAIGSQAETAPATGVGPGNLAYVTFTSGSTGRPKGVQIAHGSVVNFLETMAERPGLGSEDALLSVTTISFDISVLELFGPLTRGARLRVVSRDTTRDGRALAEAVERTGATIVQGTPATWRMMLDAGWSRSPELKVLCGGQALTRDLAESLTESGGVVWNMYGPTETTIWSTLDRVESGEGITIGRPIANTQVYVLDGGQRPVPVGVAGELYIGGDGVSRGYRGRTDLTAERFVPSPYAADGGARLYRTGDQVRYLTDGRIEFVGRVDHQVKIRGFRIELGEIEDVLARHEAVHEVVVTTHESAPGAEILCAYVVAGQGEAPSATELRTWAGQTLAEYMVPAAFVMLDALPLTPNGKIDRRALPAPDASAVVREGTVAPRTPYEEILADIWRGVLGVEVVGVHDDFFELGGHSLLATQVTSRVRTAFDVDLPVRELFENATVAKLAAVIEQTAAGDRSKAPALTRTDRTDDLPLSFAQERLWFIDQLDPGSSAYNIPTAMRLSGRLDISAISQAVDETLRRQSALRSTFSVRDGKPRLDIGSSRSAALRVVDLSGLPALAREAESKRVAVEEGRVPFDLSKGPLFRATLLTLDATEHVLLLTLHHIVSDAWSMGVLVGDVAALYQSYRRGTESDLTPLPVQFTDYAAWQRDWLDGGGRDEQLGFWRDRLAGAPSTLELPTDRPRPVEQTYRGATMPVRLSKDLANALRALGESTGATPFMTLLSGFYCLLSRYTGQTDLVVGTPIAGRNRAEIEGLVGFFVNTLALRAELGGDPTAREVLEQVRETALGAYANQDLPLEKLLEELDVERDLSRTPLFQVLFVLQNAPVQAVELGDLSLEPMELRHDTAKFDLTLNLSETSDGFGGVMEYNTDLFDASTIERMAAHFETLLGAMLVEPDVRLSELPVLSEAEREQLVVEWNDTERVDEHVDPIHQLVEVQVARSPDAIALVTSEHALTYRELNAQANRLARHLRGLGVGPEVRVGLCLSRSPDMVVSVLGILKAGGTYVGIDPEYPAARVAFIIEDSNAAVMLTETSISVGLPEHDGVTVCVDAEAGAIAKQPDVDLAPRGQPAFLSHVIYTSGSTGRPKGVAIERKSVATLVQWSREHYSDLELSGVLAGTSVCFDLSVWEMLVPLSYGGTIVLGANALELGTMPTRDRVTLVNTVPSAIAELLRQEAVPASVHTVNLAGEFLTTRLSDAIYEMGTVRRVCDLYGPSEDTTYSTFAQREPGGEATIGRPLANTRAYLRSAAVEPTPIGVPGELHLGGHGLARGYLDRPDLTAERFVPDPYAAVPGERVYRTGDLVRWLPKGMLEFLGRIDHQVKVRGFRIELGEVEAVLTSFPGVQDVVVVARDDARGAKRLVAYVTGEEGPPSENDLRDHAREHMPGYMVPSAIVVLDALPLTPNGKVDRKALPEPGQAQPELAAAFTAPSGLAEETLARIWSDVLTVDDVGRHDNFFQLGGDSILSIQIVSKANDAGLKISPKQVFQNQTVAELAAVAGAGVEIEAEQGLVVGPVPVTPIQEWFLDQDRVDPQHFNQAVLLEASESLDTGCLLGAFEAILAHHDALRLRLQRVQGQWRQEVVGPADVFPLERVDLSMLAQSERQDALEQGIASAHKGMDLESGPLVQVRHFVLGDDQGDRLLIVVHHLAVDGVSWRVLLEDLQAAYEQLEAGEAVRLPPKTTSFRSWAERLTEFADGEGLGSAAEFWSATTVDGTRPLPRDGDGENVIGSRAVTTVALKEEETRALLTEVPDAYGTQINEVLLTALLLAVRGWTASASLLVDLEGHGREDLFEDVDLSRTVGWFTTLYPVLLELPEATDLGTALKSVKEQLRTVPQHGIGYGLLRYLRHVDSAGAALAEGPQAEVLFNYLGQFDQVLPDASRFRWADEGSGNAVSERAGRTHLLDVSGIIHRGSLRLNIEYCEEIHRSETIAGLAEDFVTALRALVEHCRAPDVGGYTPSDFPLARLPQADLDRLLGPGRDVEDVYPLSPMQEGLLFHTLYAQGSGVYVTQVGCTLRGEMDPVLFREAWKTVIDRHAVLRTSFHLDDVEWPVQVVRRGVMPEWDEQDWGAASSIERQTRVEAYLFAERTRGFDPRRAPLMRLALIRLGVDETMFVWSHHHSLLDGWSAASVLTEVLSTYEALLRDEVPTHQPVRPYREYIGWLADQDMRVAEAFWREALGGFSAPTPLPGARSTAQPGEHAGHAELSLRIPETTTSALLRLGRDHHITLNTVVQGVWALVLGQYSGTSDVVFGSTVSGRPANLPGIESMVGLFINTVATRVRVDERLDWITWLTALQDEQLEARQYEFSPLVEVQRWSEIPPGRSLFDSLLIFESYPVDEALAASQRSLEITEVVTEERTNYPLALYASPGRELAFKLSYDPGRFPKAAVERVLTHLSRLLEAVATAPEARVSELGLLTEGEAREQLEEWNATERSYADEQCVHELFEAQVEAGRDRVALEVDGTVVSYGALDARANQLARHLRSLGVGPDGCVGICLPRGVDLVVGLLGIQKAGGGYVPLDPAYPEERLRIILEDAGVSAVVTEEALRVSVSGMDVPVVSVDGDADAIGSQAETAPATGVGPGNLAYVTFTSGSTGRPKGVQIAHGSVVNFLETMAERPGLGSEDALLSVTTISFDISVLELFGPLTRGARLRVVSRDTTRDGRALAEAVEGTGATIVQGTPATWRMMLDAGWSRSPELKVLCGGQALTRDLAESLTESGGVVWNMYGPTETTIWSTLDRVESGEEITIGRPIANTQVYVLDSGQRPVPVGVAGELYIGGDGVSRGYRGRTDLTAERFVPSPYAVDGGARLYRTGDQVRYLADGHIEFVGRVDHQVKIRGFRIELGEIEEVLARHEAVHEVVVTTHESAPGAEILCAYVVAGQGEAPSATELRTWAGQTLADYMVPAAFVMLDALPLTPNGKIDRRALPAPDASAVVREGTVAPRTPYEEMLADIWRGVLGVEVVGVHDDFFELGGHSLLATQVTSRVRTAFDVDLPVRELFENATVAKLAAVIEQTAAGGDRAKAPALTRTDRTADLPLSFAQERLWFIDQLDPGSSAYNIPATLRITGSVNIGAVEKTLQEIVRRHEALRTSFPTVAGEPVQRIDELGAFRLCTADLSGLPKPLRESHTRALVSAEAVAPFDLTKAPLLRGLVIRFSPEDHGVVLTMHHVVSDGWSMGVLVREIGELYGAFTTGTPSPLPDVEVQYADYAVWQRGWLDGAPLENQIAYWQEALADPAPLDLATDRPRPGVQTFRGANYPVNLPESLSMALADFGRREGATLFMTLMAAFHALLHRYTGQADILVGTPIAGRTREEVEGLIGFFANTLVVRTDSSGDPTFRTLIDQVREAALGAYAHQDVPFERLVGALGLDRDLSRSPLFDVMFVLQNRTTDEFSLGSATLTSLESGQDTAKFDLTLNLSETSNGFDGVMEYNTDLFDESTIERMVAHFETLLGAMVAEPDRKLSELPVLSEAERERLLVEWNETERVDEDVDPIHQLVEAQVARSPDAIALVTTEHQLTYRELNARANRLARHLRGLGVGPEVRVGVCLSRSPDMVVSVLGILKAGGTYVGIDPEYPATRVAFIIEDSDAAVMLTETSILDRLPDHDGVTVCVDAEAGEIAKRSDVDLAPWAQPTFLSHVIYTSGSTGRPKGVAIERKSIATLVQWSREHYSDVELSGVLAGTSVCFDLSVWEMFVPLSCGGTIVLAANALALGTLPARERVTLLNTVPSAIAELLRQEAVPSSVQTVNLAGEVLTTSLSDAIYATETVRRVCDLYGPSEDTTYSTYAQREPGGIATIGRPLANTRAYLRSAAVEPTPIGVPGELHLGGNGLARGYLDRPDLTAERFVPDPYATVPGERVYRTGDLVRWLPEGMLEFLGRMDHQVKIRGFRIELGEVEAVLASFPDVQDVVVVARDDARGAKRLAAYVTGQEGPPSESELRAHARQHMPAYMVPTAIVVLDVLPLTPNGKVDRKALPEPDLSKLVASGFVEPRTPHEHLIADAWRDLLGVERVGVHDDFFELGGHSLLATRVMSRVMDLFDTQVPLRRLFEAPTVAGLAAVVDDLVQAGLGTQVRAIEPRTESEASPLSFAQERLWFLDQLEPGGHAYNLSTSVRVHGALSIPVFEMALSEIVRRHEVLRTHFEDDDTGRPTQVVSTGFVNSCRVVDLIQVPESTRTFRIEALAREESRRPFDLRLDSPLRVLVLRIRDDVHVVLFTLHHIASDGWSNEIFVEELATLYETYADGLPSGLSDLRVQYADYAAWQREWLEGEALEAQVQYWRDQLAAAPQMLDLPTDHPRPAVQSLVGATLDVVIPEDLSFAIDELCRAEGTTPFMTLLAVFQVLLHKYTGQRDVVVGSPIAGRNRPETEGLIGFFVNTLPLRGVVRGSESFRDLLVDVREKSLGAYANQDVPFERIVEEVQPERDLSRSPLFQAMFILQNVPTEEKTFSSLRLTPVEGRADTAKFDLTLSLRRTAEGYRGTFEYCSALFERVTIERMIGHLQVLLRSVTATPDTRISALPILEPAERADLIAEWSAVGRDLTGERTLSGMVERWARETPDRVALMSANSTISYAALNARANRLARRLVERGVGPDVRVGLFLERSPEMVVAVLAVAKAGGAYVPLDPTYPDRRLSFIVKDADPEVVLVQGEATERLGEAEERLGLDPQQLLQIDSSRDSASTVGDPDLNRPVSPGQLAYLIYTSGSTGQPKGTMIPHSGLMNYLSWAGEYYAADKGSGAVVHSPLGFDLTVTSLLAPLVSGQVVHLLREGAAPDALGQFLDRHRDTTLLKLTPSHLSLLEQQVSAEVAGDLARVLVVGGEELTTEVLKFWRDNAPLTRIVNEYGPTETVVGCCVFEAGASAEIGDSVPIGRPIANTRLHVCDRYGEVVPVGVSGELHIGGAGVTRGYRGRPDLTAASFVPDPFSSSPGERLYKSGDRTRVSPQGLLEFQGRIDHQVKVRGFRVELGEIETLLERHERVNQAVVLTRVDGSGANALFAFVTGDISDDVAGLRAYLAEIVPAYMVPVGFKVLDTFPLTPNGKVDRDALPDPDVSQGDAETSIERPVTTEERVLAEIWTEILGVASVGRHDDFFELGGHSLLGTQVTSRIRRTLGVELPLRALFEAPTLAGLAARIVSAGPDGPSGPPPLVARRREGAHPLSFAQQRLWLLDRMKPGDASYNVFSALRLRGGLEVATLEQSFSEILRRQEVLRAVFVEEGGTPAQVIQTAGPFAIVVTDLTALEEEAREAAAKALTAQETGRPFDLSRGPLIRLSVLKMADDDHILVFTSHHIVSDGWSLGVLVEELTHLYVNYRSGGESGITDLPIQYTDFAAWQREWLQGEALEGQLSYWRERLGGNPPRLALPTDRPRPSVENLEGRTHVTVLPPDLTAGVRALSRNEGASLFMTLLAAFKTQLQRYTGEDDILIGTDMASRNHEEVEGLIGFFINLLVLRTDLGGNPTFRELLARVRDGALRDYAHQELPFDKLVEELQPERHLSDTPIFQVLFVLQNTPMSDLELGSTAIEVLPVEVNTSKFDLAVFVLEGDERIVITWQFKTELFDTSTIERLARHFQVLLSSIVQDPDAPISGLKMIEAKKRARRGRARSVDLTDVEPDGSTDA